MNIFNWIRRCLEVDIQLDGLSFPELSQPAVCDKHSDLLKEIDDDAAIARYQARIIANGGTVHVVTPQEHAARLRV